MRINKKSDEIIFIGLFIETYIRYILYICYIRFLKQNKVIIIMKKLIEIDDTILTKLKVLSAFEGLSVKALMEKAIELFVKSKEKEQLDSLTDEQKEDIGLLFLMQQADRTDTVSREEIFKLLE